MEITEKISFLKNVNIFSEIKEDILTEICLVLQEVTIEKGQEVFHRGDPGNSMYIIIDGRVKVHDNEYVFVELSNKEIFGEYALLDTEPRSTSVTTMIDTQFFVLEQDRLYQLMEKSNQVLLSIMKSLTKRLRQHNILQEKLAESNARLKQAKKMVEQEKKQVELLNEEINRQLDKITHQASLLEDKNRKITDSINYAENIQSAMLPTSIDLQQAFHDLFVYYKPRDVVSGDFYWLKELPDRTFIAAVDCTGHGVPGALMSMAGSMLLNEIVGNHKILQVEEILYHLNKGVESFLQQKDNTLRDGMDISLCSIYKQEQKVDISSAKSPVILFQKQKHQIIKGSKYSIGGGTRKKEKTYTKTTINYQDQDLHLYLFSDGYIDQMNPWRKRFSKKQLLNLLAKIHPQPMHQQKLYLQEKMQNWMATEEQIDDMLVIGIHLSM